MILKGHLSQPPTSPHCLLRLQLSPIRTCELVPDTSCAYASCEHPKADTLPTAVTCDDTWFFHSSASAAGWPWEGLFWEKKLKCHPEWVCLSQPTRLLFFKKLHDFYWVAVARFAQWFNRKEDYRDMSPRSQSTVFMSKRWTNMDLWLM